MATDCLEAGGLSLRTIELPAAEAHLRQGDWRINIQTAAVGRKTLFQIHLQFLR